MEYKTYPPQRALASFIKCFWSLNGPASDQPERQRIVPDGCMEMIFNDGDRYQQFLSNGDSILQPSSFVFGQITDPLEIAPTGVTGILAVRFYPDGFAPFATIPIRDMDNRAVSLTELYGGAGEQLGSDVLIEKTNEARIAVIETFLLNRLNSQEAIDSLARSSVEMLFRTNGQTSIEDLTEQLNINRRQLERRFASVIGLSPKQLSRIIRLQNVLKLMERNQFTTLTALALENGYFDQAHFIKDFKEFTGMSPRQFYGDNLKLSSLFIGTE